MEEVPKEAGSPQQDETPVSTAPLPEKPTSTERTGLCHLITHSAPWMRVRAGELAGRIRTFKIERRTLPRVGGALLLVICIIAGAVYLWSGKNTGNLPEPVEYADVYRFVPETVSKSASIRISLPQGVAVATPESTISFVPEIQGHFVVADEEQTVVFIPDDPLTVGSYYSTLLEQPGVSLQGTFKVAEDPKVLAVFPNAQAEVHEDTNISIVFNRPVVPLSTLALRDQFEVPAVLEPEVPGTWVWKSTRMLTFIPETTLEPATTYTVRVHDGMRSVEGLTVPASSHLFTTRSLKVVSSSDSSLTFKSPYVVRFNMPVDLERIREGASLTRDGKKVSLRVRYGTKVEGRRGLLGLIAYASSDVVDKTVLEFVPHEDSHGRDNLWDFDASYTLKVERFYPLVGAHPTDTSYERSITIFPVLASLTAVSPRSSYASPELFDPQGELVASFYEDVDLGKLKVQVKGLTDMRYGEQCKKDDEGREVYKTGSSQCEKEENKKEVRVRFAHDGFGQEEQVPVRFERVVAADGTVATTEPIEESFTTYPAFSVTPIIEDEGEGGSLTTLRFCSNTPLKHPAEGELRERVRANNYLVFPDRAWRNSRKVTYREEFPGGGACEPGMFLTEVRYGLHPSVSYTLTLALTDDFDGRAQRTVTFKTRPPEGQLATTQSLQPMYNTTVPGRSKLVFSTENMEEVRVHLCKVRAGAFLSVLEKYPEERDDTLTPPAPCIEERTKVIDLPDRYFVFNYFEIDVGKEFGDPRGQYIITVYHPTFSAYTDGPQYLRSYLNVTTLAVGHKQVSLYRDPSGSPRSPLINARDLYWVLRTGTLAPVEGATITPYSSSDLYGAADTLVQGTRGTTGSDGVVRIAAVSGTRGAVITAGSESTVVSNWSDQLTWESVSPTDERTYLYTDRPIYRPGDTVHGKGIDRVGYDGAWRIIDDVPANVSIRDSRSDEVSSQTAPMSDFGTFEFSYEIPKNAPLGYYSVSAFDGYASFEVEEYTPAPFKVKLGAKEEEYTAGETAEVQVDASYYFGMPVSGGEVEYDVVSSDYHFYKYTGEYFSFGRDWYSCRSCWYGDRFLTRGSLTLDSDGKGTISLPLDVAKLFHDPENVSSQTVTFRVRVKDASGRQVSGTDSVIMHRGEYYLGVRVHPYFVQVGQPATVQVKSVDTSGEPVSVRDITRTISKVTWESYRRREVDGGFYWHSEEKREEVHRDTITTDSSGNAGDTYVFPSEGEYEVLLTGTDRANNTIRSATRVYVYGEGYVSFREQNNNALEVKLDKQSYTPGETATVLYESPFKRARALVTVERGDIYSHETFPTTNGLKTTRVAIGDVLIPNAYVSVLLVSDGPEVRAGSVGFTVNADSKRLSVGVETNKSTYLPGEKVDLSVTTQDSGGRGVPADVSISVVDLSVLALVGNPKKNPFAFFYQGLPYAISTFHTLKNILVERTIPTGTKGGGGADELENKKRGVFRDTAFWAGRVLTDASGTAHLSFTLPDNITTWQIESIGSTKALQVGIDYDEITTKKRLMVIPKKPRFIMPGDTFKLGMQVFNNTDAKQKVVVAIDSTTLTMDAVREHTLSVEPGQSTQVYVGATAPLAARTGYHEVTFSARYEDGSDVVEERIPLGVVRGEEVVATASAGPQSAFHEYLYLPSYVLPGDGGLTVTARTTFGGFLLGAAHVMRHYPYACTEQIASRLGSLAQVRRIANTFDIPEDQVFATTTDDIGDLDTEFAVGLPALYARQTPDGGFAYYPGMEPSHHLTSAVVRALGALDAAGVEVEPTVVSRAVTYLKHEFEQELYVKTDAVVTLAFALRYPIVSTNERSFLVPHVQEIVKNKLDLEQLSTASLGMLTIASRDRAYGGAYDTLFATLENRLSFDARGTYLRDQGTNRSYWSYETPEKNAALFVGAVAAGTGTHEGAPGVLRWLLARRDRDGSWGTTDATFTVLEETLNYLIKNKEHDTHTTIAFLVGDTEHATVTVTPSTPFTTLSLTVPIDALERNKLIKTTLTNTPSVRASSTLYYDMALRYRIPAKYIAPRDEGITIERVFTNVSDPEVPISEASVGDIIEGTLTITVPDEYSEVAIEDPLPAGLELVNERFVTERATRPSEEHEDEVWSEAWRENPVEDPKQGRVLYPSYNEKHDDRLFAFVETLSPGTYTYTYLARALVPGTFTHEPARAWQMYFPEVFGRTPGGSFTVVE